MGFGFLLIIGIICLTLATAVIGILLGFTKVLATQGSWRKRIWRGFVSFSVPMVFPLVLSIGILLMGFFNEVVRGTDIGFGDSWKLRLGHGLSLLMIDDTETASIVQGRDDLPVAEELIGFQQLGSLMVAMAQPVDQLSHSAAQPYFVIDPKAGTVRGFANLNEMESELGRDAQISDHWQSPAEFYAASRNAWVDFLLIAIVLIASCILTFQYGSLVARHA